MIDMTNNFLTIIYYMRSNNEAYQAARLLSSLSLLLSLYTNYHTKLLEQISE